MERRQIVQTFGSKNSEPFDKPSPVPLHKNAPLFFSVRITSFGLPAIAVCDVPCGELDVEINTPAASLSSSIADVLLVVDLS